MSDPEIVKLKNAINENDHSSGSQAAPVTLLEYGNFECIDCGRAYPVIKEVQRLLRDDLRLVFRHFPTVRTHPHAMRAAQAAEAAALQQKFWEMHDQLFTHQQALEDHDLSRYAKRIGLDVERFARDMADTALLKQVETEYQSALFDEHVTGTPTLYINDMRYTGATDIDSLLIAIKIADVEGRVRLPAPAKGVRRLLARFHRGPNR
jgi:protein-disulfide isomerase